MTRKLLGTLVAVALAFAVIGAGGGAAQAEETKILKIATLAPEGSSWMKILHEWASSVEKRAPGLKIKFYAGGIAGDERDAVRKMRLNQINGAVVTAIGLGLLAPEVRVLEVPFMIRNYAELDYVRGQLDGELRKKFDDKGYVLLSWGDVGPVHLFTNTPLVSEDDLPKLKLWAWTDDPVVRTLFQQLGLNGVPLGVPDVLPSLQTGLINACYGSPLSTVALQWHSKVKFITSMVISQSIGATVLAKSAFDGLPPETQKIIMEESRKVQEKLLRVVREDNVGSLKKMEAQGIKVIPTPAGLQKKFEDQATIVGQKLEGQLYSHEFHLRVEKLLADYRAAHK